MPPRIIIFEDNDRLRESLSYLLGMNNYKVVGDFNQCTEAANIVRVHEPDVVLMDIDMPMESGIKGVKAIKEARPATAVIMYTVFEDDDKLFECLCAGANGYLLKKTPPAKLFDAIQEVLEGGAPMSPTIARKVLNSFQTSKEANKYQLSPREIQKENPEFRTLEDVVHFLRRVYTDDISVEDTVTVIHFSPVSEYWFLCLKTILTTPPPAKILHV